MVIARSLRLEPGLSSVLKAPDVLGNLAFAKLKREASVNEPNLLRCLSHHNLFKKCVTASQESTAQPAVPQDRPQSVPFRHRSTSKNTSSSTPIPGPSPIPAAFKRMVKSCAPSPSSNSNDDNGLARVQASVSQGSSSHEGSRNHQSPSKTVAGAKYFARLKLKMSGKAAG
ncbi:hypothetical protein BJX61DRAFT_503548 [Aspergillus egyptiacus]|nr:hypothetical protein BJX61DRAFT_503548 [Aspergillus egyptiacus]